MTFVGAAVATMFGEDVLLVFQVQQGPIVMVAAEDDAPSVTSVTAVGTAVGLVFHVSEVCRSPAAFSGAADDAHIVYKVRFHLFASLKNKE